jgi:hypothetical protein
LFFSPELFMSHHALVLVLALAACKGQVGPAGPPGADGAGLDPSVSAVLPDTVYLHRYERVTISGNATTWDADATVDFGDGIDVVTTVVASPTAIVATINVAADAEIGPRDVSVTSGETTVTYAGAFDIEAPLEVYDTIGTVAQGSVIIADAAQLDTSAPFDTTVTGDGYFTPITYTNMHATWGEAEGLTTSFNTVSSYSAQLFMLVDVDATTGDLPLSIDSGPEGRVVTSDTPLGLTLAPRTATLLEPGATNGHTTDPYESALFQIDVPAGDTLKLSIASDEYYAVPGLIILPESGHYADLITYAPSARIDPTDADTTYYAIVWDNYGFAGYDYTITADSFVAVPDGNDTCDVATSLGDLPAHADNLGLLDAYDQDWYTINVSASDIGKVLHIVTSPGEVYTDTQISVYQGCGGSAWFGPYDTGFQEDVLTQPIEEAGTYHVLIENSSWGWNGEGYVLDITAEDAP